MAQIISILDAYGYVPMIRQVFSHRVFGPHVGRTVDEAQICVGMENSLRVLSALESIIEPNGPIAGAAVWSLEHFPFTLHRILRRRDSLRILEA
jgi:glutathione S-transferase